MIPIQNRPRILAFLAGLLVFPISSQAADVSVTVQVVTGLPNTSQISADNCKTTQVNDTGRIQDYRVLSNVRATPRRFTLAHGDYQVIRCRAPAGTPIRLRVRCIDSPERPCAGRSTPRR